MFVGHLKDEFATGGDLGVGDEVAVERSAVERDAADIDVGIGLITGFYRKFFAVFERDDCGFDEWAAE